MLTRPITIRAASSAPLVLFVLASLPDLAAQPLPAGKLRYLRPSGDGWASETVFTIAKNDDGWSIGSMTDRGSLKLSLSTGYDTKSAFTTSGLIVVNDKKGLSASANLKNGKAVVVQSRDMAIKEYSAPADAIVTSAPDWTDTLLLCARYDHPAGGKQTFPALWYHPEQPTQILKLTVERQGYDTVKHDGKDLKLARFTIELRGKSQYTAWATLDGVMVRLIPLPAKEKQRSGLVLERYEKSSAVDLQPR